MHDALYSPKDSGMGCGDLCRILCLGGLVYRVWIAPMKTYFVFGSNEAGIHGAGAARYAMTTHGAKWGVGFGPQGSSWAIPTKSWTIKTLPRSTVQFYVDRFIDYATLNSSDTFHLTKVGCGLAGFAEQSIAPLFGGAPDNVKLIDDFGKVICPARVWMDQLIKYL